MMNEKGEEYRRSKREPMDSVRLNWNRSFAKADLDVGSPRSHIHQSFTDAKSPPKARGPSEHQFLGTGRLEDSQDFWR